MDSNSGLSVSYSGPRDRFHVEVPPESIAELIAPWSGKKRAFLVGLLNGCTKRQSAARAGVTPRATQLWAKSDIEFATAMQQAEDMGFAAILEPELYAKALDRSDPGSIRALELVLRSRDERYRMSNVGRSVAKTMVFLARE